VTIRNLPGISCFPALQSAHSKVQASRDLELHLSLYSPRGFTKIVRVCLSDHAQSRRCRQSRRFL